MLLAALGVGLAGGSLRRRYRLRIQSGNPKEKQGTALGIFGVGNVGRRGDYFHGNRSCWSRSVGKRFAQVWAAGLIVTAGHLLVRD